MKASDLFIKQLEEEGVEYVFGLPGEENLDFLESLRQSKIKLIVNRHEQASAFMAATYGRLTGKAGVCFSTLGPGATNLVTGVAYAQLIGAPLVSISGQKALRNNWQAKFQQVDVVNLMKPITKKSIGIIDANNIPTIVRNAFKTAELERPGAVHIELPEDVASTETDSKIQKKEYTRRPVSEKKAILKAAEMINAAKHPLIIVSSGANRKLVTKALNNFITSKNIYVVHTQMGKGVISDDSEYSLFATGIHKRDYVSCGIERADLIITIGYNISEYPPYVWNKDLTKKIVNIDFIESEVDKYYNPDVEVVGDIAYTLWELWKIVNKRKKDSVFQKTRESVLLAIDEKTPKNGNKLLPQEVVKEVRKSLSQDDILTLDNGIYKLWFSRLYKTYNPNTFLLDNALATMGAGLPSGIVAKMLNPKKNVLAVVGDGGFMMNSQEIETAIRYKIPIVVLLLNDNGYGFIKWKQENMNFKNFALDLGNPDFVKYAESYGAIGIRLNKKDSLSDTITKAFKMNKVVIIECPIDYSQNYEEFSKKIPNIVCNI